MVGEPKTLRGRRPIALDPVKVLKPHRKAMLEERIKLGGAFKDEGLVVHRVDGRCLRPEGVSDTFKRIGRRPDPVVRQESRKKKTRPSRGRVVCRPKGQASM